MLRLLLYCFILVLPLLGQSTQIQPSQLKTGTTPAVASQVYLVGYSLAGPFRSLTIGTGLMLVPNPVDGTLAITLDTSRLKFSARNESRKLVRNATGGYDGGDQTCTIVRNGLIQTQGDDYTFQGNTVIPNPMFPWQPGNVDIPPDTAQAICPVLIGANP
jgi:hypothetical protein